MTAATAAVNVLIIGGGMVGASLALALSTASGGELSVRVIEARALPGVDSEDETAHASFDARSTALSLSSHDFFVKLGIWSALIDRAQPIRRIHVSDRGRFGSTQLDCRDHQLDALGYVVENPWLGRCLYAALAEAPGVSVQAPARVEKFRRPDGSCLLQDENGEHQQWLLADLVVLADGAGSASCATLGIDTSIADYGHNAVIANVCHDRDHAGLAFERFTEHGPMALLPLVNDADGRYRSALIWVNDARRAETIMALEDGAFLRELQNSFGYRAGRFRYAGCRNVYPLRLSSAREQVRRNLVVLGNAAHTLHPVAGQGFNLSLRDAARLADCIQAARLEGRDIGDLAVLQRYLRDRQLDQARTMRFSDWLPKVFADSFLPLALARDAGLIGLDLVPGLRSQLVRLATGYAGA